MNQEDFMKAMDLCVDHNCEYCPFACVPGGVPGCMNELLRKARELILSLLAEKKDCVMKNQDPEPWTRQRVLREAEKCVCGRREQDYGTPEDSFNIIADLWAGYLQGCGVSIDFLESHDVAIMLALLKIARISKNPQHMDSWVDLAGYAACGGEIAGKDSEQGGSHEN